MTTTPTEGGGAVEILVPTLITWGADQTRRLSLNAAQLKELTEAMKDGRAYAVGKIVLGTRNITTVESLA